MATFLERLKPIAMSEQKRTGVLASITLAQAALESAWGQVSPGNNLFGIKGDGQEFRTQEYVNGSFISVVAGFRTYKDWDGSVRDHSDLLCGGSYAPVLEACKRLDYGEAARQLQECGYATDPLYAVKLRGIINQYRLYELDKEAARRMEEWEATCIINTWIKPSWNEAEADRDAAKAAGDEDAVKAYESVMDSCHDMANACRRAAGLPEE